MFDRVELTFEKKKNISNDLSIFSFRVNPINFSFKAGQYLNLGISHEGELLFRPFSIASLKGAYETIDFVIPYRSDGLFSKYVFSLNSGDVLKAEGPFGSMILDNVNSDAIFFFSTGTGIVPFRSMLLEIRKLLIENKIIHLYTQQENIESIPFLNEFIELAKEFSNFNFKIFSCRCYTEVALKYFESTQLLDYIPEISFTCVDTLFACGNPNFIKSLKTNLMYLKETPQTIITD